MEWHELRDIFADVEDPVADRCEDDEEREALWRNRLANLRLLAGRVTFWEVPD